jgi:GR25 family glycosyltransferase involved in LPS biosynthesis
MIKIINLKRRNDRKEAMIQKFEKENITDYEFIEAVDGYSLEFTYELFTTFKGNDFQYRKGFIGCALSYIHLWNRLLNDSDNEYYIIMEDDINIVPDFKNKISLLNSHCKEKDFVFLGYSMYEQHRKNNYNKYNNQNNLLNIEKLNREFYLGGFFCYSINKKGASKILNFIKKHGIKHGIDYYNKIVKEIDSYEVTPQLAFTEWNENDKPIDTDIQNFQVFDVKDFLYNEFVFIKGVDQSGCDILRYYKNIELCMNKALFLNNCIGFNSLGFFKNNLIELKPSIYYGKEDGIFIKKDIYEKFINK